MLQSLLGKALHAGRPADVRRYYKPFPPEFFD
jgi:hypothetical protein